MTSGASTTRFAYDGLDRIAEYDGAGSVVRRYFHGPGIDEPIVWYEGSGLTDRYVHGAGIDEPLVQYVSTTPRFLHADERGSIVAQSDGVGAAAVINRYDEYGIPGSGNAGRFQYTGQAWLSEVGLYYYKNRVYSPTLGRFLQPDPIGYADSPNLYAYVLNDPVNLIDPLGLQGKENETIVVTLVRYWEAAPSFTRDLLAGFVTRVEEGIVGEAERVIKEKVKKVGKKAFCAAQSYNLGIDAGLFRGLGARVNAGVTFNTATGQLFGSFTFTGGAGFGAGVSFGLAGQTSKASAGNWGSIDSIGSGGFGRVGGSGNYNWANVSRGKLSSGSGFSGSAGVGTKQYSGAYASPLAISLNYSTSLGTVDTPCD